MKTLILFAILFSLVTCTMDNNDYFDDPLELKSAEKVEKELKLINFTGHIEYDFSIMQGVILGSGNCSHLGKIKLAERWNVTETGAPLSFVDGTMTASNGDLIYFQWSPFLTWTDESGNNHMGYEFIGGTGRFKEVEGYMIIVTEMDWANLSLTAEGAGIIVY